ncbi:MAG: hypothetical protein MAG431_00329 [Chloroflexi bacterium]|nr:hypothetical protein [Chloroflexota bacterium]
MPGETNLEKLLKDMHPTFKSGVYVFCTVPAGEFESLDVRPVATMVEEEGVTLILTKSEAEKNKLACTFPSRMITLNVHSSLDAVGFLAAVTERLAMAGISTNAVSGYYHDHLFVPVEKAEQAMKVLDKVRCT